MIKVIADTGAIIALLDEDDKHHGAVVQVAQSFDLLIPVTILPEVDYLVTKYLGEAVVRSFLDAMTEGSFIYLPIEIDDICRTTEIMSRYSDIPIGFVDASLVAHGLSSRVEVTATSARFIYHYSDFRGDPIKVLEHCFDLMFYIASFGVRQLAIRFPKKLVNPAAFAHYCDTSCISVSTTDKSTILNINIANQDYSGWIMDDSWLPDLVGLREELLQGDLRLLHLAWLQSGFAEDADVELENMIEPPMPANLKHLSPALESFVEVFDIDRDLIAVAADASPTNQAIAEPIEDWIAALPEAERNQYLIRVAKGETHVGAELMQHLRQLFSQPIALSGETSGRSLADLVAIAEGKRNHRKHKEKQAAEKARRK
jgi:predicted nucleic acid-binding protein